MSENTRVSKLLATLTREIAPPNMSDKERLNDILGRQRTMTLRLPIMTHWLLHRASASLGQSKTGLAQDLLEAAAQDAIDALQASGHLPSELDLFEAAEYYRETTKSGEASEPGEPVIIEADEMRDLEHAVYMTELEE